VKDLAALVTKRPWVVLPIETKVRELYARVLLAAVCAEQGAGVVIGRLADFGLYAPALPPAVVLQTNALTTELSDSATVHGHMMTALDEEGLVYRDQKDYLARRVSVESVERCERFFAWGEVHRHAVLSKVPNSEGRVIAAGNPRLDTLRPELRAIYRSEAEELEKQYGEFVLINTNLATYNHWLGTDHRIREWASAGWSSTEEGAMMLQRLLTFQRSMLEEFTALIEALAEALPNRVAIVLRPHPSERFETWREKLGHLPSVTVVHEGSVVPWLMASKALIHNSCTTGIEATLLERPSFAYMPVRDELSESSLPNESSLPVGDLESMVDAALTTLEQPGSFEKPALAGLTGHIEQLAGRLASEVIAGHLLAVSPPPSSFDDADRLARKIRRSRLRLRIRSVASATFNRKLGEERRMRSYVRETSQWITGLEVAGILRALKDATGRFEGVSSEHLGPDLVIVGTPQADRV
jgi:surface carbohydrate biosynthesis protein